MIYLGLGILGFILLLFYDICSICDKYIVKYFFGISGFFLIVMSSVALLNIGSNVTFAYSFRWISLIMGVISLFLLIYSVFIEVGKNTYKFRNENKLVTTGTYALSRHPGVLWFLFVYLFGAIYFQNYFILGAGLIWTVINIIYVYLQERFIFVKLFENYDTYILSTPMILPSYQSIEKCLTTLNWRKR